MKSPSRARKSTQRKNISPMSQTEGYAAFSESDNQNENQSEASDTKNHLRNRVKFFC